MTKVVIMEIQGRNQVNFLPIGEVCGEPVELGSYDNKEDLQRDLLRIYPRLQGPNELGEYTL